MPDNETLSHTKWDCKDHVVFIPKYRRKALYHELRRHLGEVCRSLAAQKECRIEEGYLMADHVHMLLSIPPKYSVLFPRSTPWPRSLASSRGKRPFTLPGRAWDDARTIRGIISGLGGPMSRRSAEMRRLSENTSVHKRLKIADWPKWACGKGCRL
jgi:REP element-mobilizing transposase RayT